jgi:transglutaminase-like putative cysteine protease
MKTKHLTLFLFLFLLFSNANAQEFKLGKVSIVELEQKVHLKDTAAVAAILFKKGETRFEYSQNDGFIMYTDVKIRIKIYKKEGYGWANHGVEYYVGSNELKESVTFSNAITYNLVGGKIEKTKLKSDGEFDEKVNKYWNRSKITMPNVKVGSIIEFEYTLKTPRYGTINKWDFQTNIPVDYVEYKTNIPEYFIYNPNQKGYVFPKVNTDKKEKTIILTSKEAPQTKVGGYVTASETVNYEEIITTFIAEKLPAMKEEAFVNNIENYTSSVTHELMMTKFPNSFPKSYSTDWNTVVKAIYDNDDFGSELNKTSYFENDLKAVVAGLTKQDEIILAVLNYVKSSVKWNGYYGYSCNEGVKQAYKGKTGNAAEINLMLTAMLRNAGLDANPVLVSTRSNGIALFPNRTAFNYVIAAVETLDGLILLDATDKFSTPNVLPFRDLNWQGRLIRKDGTSEGVDLMPKKASNNYVMMSYAIDDVGKVTGKLRRQRTDHNAMSFRYQIENTKEEEYLEKLENENEKIEIADYSRTNEKDIQLPITETCSFTGTNLCEIIGEKIYINPLLFFTTENNPFKQDVREYPVDFGFPFLDKYIINIDIPEGYTVETFPKSAQLNMEDDLGSFKFISNAAGNKIQLSISHQINTPIVSSEYYSMLKEYYQGMIAKQTEKIVLKKV